MNKYEKALKEIKERYDAFNIYNTYRDFAYNTHKEQFELLATLPNLSLEKGVLCWLLHKYDCYYKDELVNEEKAAFEYIRNIIKWVKDNE